MWHQRYVLCQAISAHLLSVIGSVSDSLEVCWVVTSDGDVYPEVLEVNGNNVEVRLGDDEEEPTAALGRQAPP